jgi:hypothetical protein
MNRALSAAAAALFLAAPAVADDTPAPDPAKVRSAVEKALPLLRAGAEGHSARRSCFACHSQGLPMLAVATAREHGIESDPEFLTDQSEAVLAFLESNRENYRQGRGQGGQADTATYALYALEAAGRPRSATTDAVVEYLLRRDKDRWRTSGNRPPSEGSDFTVTWLGLRALRVWAPESEKERVATRVAAAREWLLKTKAKDTEDRVFRLRALKEAGADAEERKAAADALLETQRADGGWSQLDSLESDAYATGTALVALHEAGSPADGPAVHRAVAFLLKEQREDGSWYVKTRSRPFQTYFETGFPHGKDQFISSAASGWAATALALSLPAAK